MWLGIDIGTGGSRALVVDERGVVRGSRTAAHEDMKMERPQWAEQRPENWWEAAVEAVRGALAEAGVPGAGIRGIGLSGQMHGLVILDGGGRVIRPSLIWCDQRSQAQVDAVNAKLGRENILRYIANPVLTGFTLPKLLWVRDYEPENFARVRKVLLPKDYVRLQLTGEYATEVSDASGTALFDVVHRRWSYEMMDGLGLDRSILPRCYESSEITGVVGAEAAELTGLKAGTPVVGGGGDQAASAVAMASYIPEWFPAPWAHRGWYSRTWKRWPTTAPGGSHVLPRGARQVARDGRYARRRPEPAVVSQPAGAGGKLRRADCRSRHQPARRTGSHLAAVFDGERTPHLDARARGGWIGLTASHTRADLIRAVIEGVSYSQRIAWTSSRNWAWR